MERGPRPRIAADNRLLCICSRLHLFCRLWSPQVRLAHCCVVGGGPQDVGQPPQVWPGSALPQGCCALAVVCGVQWKHLPPKP